MAIQFRDVDSNSINDNSLYKKRMTIEELLIYSTETNCSDLYIKENDYPYISRFGKLIKLPCQPTSTIAWNNFYYENVTNELSAIYSRKRYLDTSISIRVPEDSKYYETTNYFRYRANFGYSMDKKICTFRMIKSSLPTFENINYPKVGVEAIKNALKKQSSINIFSASTGNGKSTTLAAVFNDLTKENEPLNNKSIITLEDPIENIFIDRENVKINQKELGRDFISFEDGIKSALREHPNCILIGECRDKEVISATIEASRTGHTVFTTFHAGDCAGAVSRILFHLGSEINLAYDLIINLGVIVSQRLLPNINGYKLDLQFIRFNDIITKEILSAIDKGKNIQVVVDDIIKNKEYQKLGYVKDWDFS